MELRPPQGVRTYPDGCHALSALLALISPGQPHLGLAPRHPHGPGTPPNPSYAVGVAVPGPVSCSPGLLNSFPRWTQ